MADGPELGADGDLDTGAGAGGGSNLLARPLISHLLPVLMTPWMMTSEQWEEYRSVAKSCPALRRHIRELNAVAKKRPAIIVHMQAVMTRASYKTRFGLMPWPLEADWVQEMEKELQKQGLFLWPKSEGDVDKYCCSVPDWDMRKGSWEEFVVSVLHIVRLHQITEFDPVEGYPVRTRFCRYNLAFFDFEKESKAERGTPFLELTSYDHKLLEGSVNVVSLKISESKVGYPIRVFGTVLVRDQVDYKCVYLFRRGKHDPQLINSPENRTLLESGGG